MKTIKKQFNKSHTCGLFIAMFFLLINSCSLEDPADPFTGTDGCLDLSTDRFVTLSIDEDGVVWSWGKSVNILPSEWTNEDKFQTMMIGSE